MREEELYKFQHETWRAAADKAQDSVRRLTVSIHGGMRTNEKLETYVKRVRDLQDVELEKFLYAVNELRKLGIEYE